MARVKLVGLTKPVTPRASVSIIRIADDVVSTRPASGSADNITPAVMAQFASILEKGSARKVKEENNDKG